MPDVKVRIDDHLIISVLNTPGGAIYQWRDEVAGEIENLARATSPVNDPLNAMHRGGEVGTYSLSWSWDRRGSQGHHNIARVINSADHAVFVEFGRSMSTKLQIFSWTEWGGGIYRVGGPSKKELKPGPNFTKRQLRFNERASQWNESIAHLPERKGAKTAARGGDHVLANATERVLASRGISVSLY